MFIVPFNDLHLQYLSIKEGVDKAIANTIANSEFILGPAVSQFEDEFSKISQASECVACANGTDALFIALRALKINPGDEVIVPAISWIATSEVVTLAGGRVKFVDVCSKSKTIDISALEASITTRTVGIIPVHLYGQAADMTSIITLADKANLWVIEDCAQAHLATHRGQSVGTFGSAGTFSFFPGKNLGAMGDAGAIISNNIEIADFSRKFSRHGGLQKNVHDMEGMNSRMDGLQASILLAKLPYLHKWTEQRRRHADYYCSKLNEILEVTLPTKSECEGDVWHLFVIEVDERDALQEHLKSCGVQTNINYPCPLPMLNAYKYLKYKAQDFPVAMQSSRKILSLPLFPEMSRFQLDHVVKSIKSFYSGRI